ncbi:flagellar hook-associated protein FlgK [Octadecabacter sp. G9-8]|uniref:Flagellar hook-associated protein 1 n=1 Tax=Octadecabacter dasysiphoniae TaxID=2909341 RepID=A0ABS9CWR1_9RHOB|nr:flagellar hook-associated protein FlgK [Octadecabacter dasysiphoniae]MCF2871588.1 flagellar hook-associated protein FlgK [Octadecabacter dasysiphoniae]
MSISNSLSNALSGMTAASRMAEVVSSNVSNSLTDGYGRRTLNLSAAVVGGRGAGVEIGSVNRHVDRGIIADRRLADASLSGFETLVSTMGRVEDVVGSAGEIGSISSRIVDVEAALIDASVDPSSATRLSSLGDRLNDLTSSLNTATKSIQNLRVEADASIASQVDTLNTSLAQVEQLNKDVTSAQLSGIDPSGLIDQRQMVIDKIAEIVPVRELDRDGGQVALTTPSGETLLDGKAKVFGFVANPVITSDMTIASTGLSGITLDGAPLSADGIGKLGGGTLGASFQVRDVELVTAQDGLDAVAADLILRFQDTSVDPSLSAGEPGLLMDGGLAYDAMNLTGLAGRIGVNAAVDPAQGGALTNLRDGINATTPGPSGNSTLLQALSTALSAPIASGADPTQKSAAARAADFEASTGAQRLNFEAELSFSNARWSGLKEAEAAGGVDTDYEMQMLLRIEQAYAANARVLQTIDTLMQRLMEI